GKLSLLFFNYSSMASPSKANVDSGPKNTKGIQDNVASETNTAVNSSSESVIQAPEAEGAEEGGLVG
ncbi:hypothetical protein A2U01_0118274, partial [Trifolium medium]|nr:hypothetical protein [Trifolium medium]